MVRILLLCLSILFGSLAYADIDPQTSVRIEPLRRGISFSTVEVNTAWTTAPSVAMKGRMEMSIFNDSSSTIVFLGDSSGATVSRWLFPRQEATFKLSSEIPIYISADTVTRVTITEIK